MTTKDVIKIGNAGGYWGDDPKALYRQVTGGRLDYISMDFLAEVTMSIMQKQRKRDPEAGYARDFLPMLESVLPKLLKDKTCIITNAGGVNPEACAEAIEQLGYTPNLSARSLRSGRTNVISLMIPDLRNAYFAELADSVMRAAAERGLSVLIEQFGDERDREIDVLRQPRSQMVDGVLYSVLALDQSDVDIIAGIATPVVLLGVSIGGHFAYATALRLESLGHTVAGLCIIDSGSITATRSAHWKARHVSHAVDLLRRGRPGAVALHARQLVWRGRRGRRRAGRLQGGGREGWPEAPRPHQGHGLHRLRTLDHADRPFGGDREAFEEARDGGRRHRPL